MENPKLERLDLRTLGNEVKGEINNLYKSNKENIIIKSEIEKLERAKRGSKIDKNFIYEKISSIIENKFKEYVNEKTIDNLIREYHVNYYENLYYDGDKDKEYIKNHDVDMYDVELETKNVFKKYRSRLEFKPWKDLDIINFFQRYKLTENDPFDKKLDRLSKIIYQSVWGYGVIEELIDEITYLNEIACNRHDYIWIQFNGKKRPLFKIRFKDYNDYERVIKNLHKNNGQGNFNSQNAISHCSLIDMQRITIIGQPIVREGTAALRIRNQSLPYISLEKMVENGSINMKFYKFLYEIREGRPNICIFGSQGHGKSTLLNSLIELQPYYLVQATQESNHELYADKRYKFKNIIGLQSTENYTREDVAEAKLRMALDNDHYGEIRVPADAYWAKQTLTRQSRGSYFTVHYDDPWNCIDGIAELICTYLKSNDYKLQRYSVAKMINFLVQTYKDEVSGKFYVKNVYEVEITDRNNMMFKINHIFKYDKTLEELIPITSLSEYTKGVLKQYDISDKNLCEIDKIFQKK